MTLCPMHGWKPGDPVSPGVQCNRASPACAAAPDPREVLPEVLASLVKVVRWLEAAGSYALELGPACERDLAEAHAALERAGVVRRPKPSGG